MKPNKKPVTDLPLASMNDLMEYIFQDRMEHLRLLSSALIHEIHTPLIIIRGRAESLLRNREQDLNKGLRDISKECQHLLKLLESMAFVSPRTDELKMQNLSLKKTLDDVLVLFEKACLDQGIVIHCELDDYLQVDSEPDRLKNILIALLSNAVDSFDGVIDSKPKSIYVHVQKDSKNLRLIISDTGCGMSLATQMQIFHSPFFSTKNKKHSSGLGLLLAQKMAYDLNLKIQFVSEEGVGSSFSLEFVRNVISL